MKNKKTKKEEGFELKDFFVSFIENFIKKIGEEIVEDIKEKARKILEQLKRTTLVVSFLFFGLIFFLIGLGLFLENFFPLQGVGFLIVGFLIFFIGLLININKK